MYMLSREKSLHAFGELWNEGHEADIQNRNLNQSVKEPWMRKFCLIKSPHHFDPEIRKKKNVGNGM